MVFCNKKFQEGDGKNNKVTILILIDGFLQYIYIYTVETGKRTEKSHNPYFNRWFSAICFKNLYLLRKNVTILILIDGFLQYSDDIIDVTFKDVTILILIDGFLQ